MSGQVLLGDVVAEVNGQTLEGLSIESVSEHTLCEIHVNCWTHSSKYRGPLDRVGEWALCGVWRKLRARRHRHIVGHMSHGPCKQTVERLCRV